MGSGMRAGAAVERFFQFWLLGLLASGYLAAAGSGALERPTVALTAAGLLLRALMVGGWVRLRIPPRWVTALTLAYVGFFPLDWLLLSRSFVPAVVHLVFFLAVLRLLTARTGRDYGLLIVLAFLQLLAAAVLSVSLNFFVFLGLFLLFGVGTLAAAEVRRSLKAGPRVARSGQAGLAWRLAASALWLTAGILTLTPVLFFVLPRTAEAAFRRLAPGRYHLPGFSDQVRLGEVGSLHQDHRAVMRVRILGPQRALALKWRGVALSGFDGKRWFNPPERPQVLLVRDRLLALSGPPSWRPGRRLSYEVLLDASAADALFFAGAPELLWINLPAVIRGPNDSFRPVGAAAVRYGVHSFLPEDSAAGLPRRPVPAQVLECCLELPPLDPRIPELARRLTRGFSSAEASARTLEAYLRQNYRYTAELPRQQVADPLADFLFVRRQGHCEYFASALAVLLRTIGIPSRLVNGFQSGVYNPVSGWQVMRASDAHSWVEAYLPAGGWTPLDPTPPDAAPRRPSPLAHLGFYLDAAETFWQEWVLGYDLTRQLLLASRMESSGRSLRARWLSGAGARLSAWRRQAAVWGLRWTAILLALAVLAALALALGPRLLARLRDHRRLRKLEHGQAELSDASLLYRRMLAALKRHGYSKPPWLTPAEFAAGLPPSELGELARRFTAAYNYLRFGGRKEALPLLLELLGRLERARQTAPAR